MAARTVHETPRLLLRSWEDVEPEDVLRVYGDPKVWRYLPGEPYGTLDRARERIARGLDLERELGFTRWAVYERRSGRWIGDCGLMPFEEGPRIEVAYLFEPESWGQGYATETARASVRMGFEDHGLDEILGVVFPENLASKRVLEKAGLTYRGRVKAYGHELCLLSVTRDEWTRTQR